MNTREIYPVAGGYQSYKNQIFPSKNIFGWCTHSIYNEYQPGGSYVQS
jgi:hypothetical protein